jgi:hypothetical protein
MPCDGEDWILDILEPLLPPSRRQRLESCDYNVTLLQVFDPLSVLSVVNVDLKGAFPNMPSWC